MSTEATVPPGFQIVQEGAARILFPDGNQVFYNKPQVVNRDLSTLVIQHFIELRKREFATKAEQRKQRLLLAASAMQTKSSESKVDDEADEAEAGSVDEVVPTSASAAATGARTSDEFDGVSILEALSATGLRAIRYAKELRGVKLIVANDREEAAVDAICRNVEFNGVATSLSVPMESTSSLSSSSEPQHTVVQPSLADAIDLMMASRHPGKQFDVVDLDPYGSAGIFLDSAMQAVAEGGLLCVTCTDMAVLCGTGSEAGFAKYGSYSLKGPFCHEQALRIVLACMQTHAARHKRYIVPLLSLSIDFYVRIFVRVYTSANIVKRSASKLASLYACTGCDHFQLQRIGKVTERPTARGTLSVKYTPALGPVAPPACPHCHFPFQLGGPLWAEPIHDTPFVEKLIASLLSQSSELQAMVPDMQAPLRPTPLSTSNTTTSTSAAASSATTSTSSDVTSSTSSSSSAAAAPAACSVASRFPGLVEGLPTLTPILQMAATKRLLSLLSLAALELPDTPLYYGVDKLHSTLHLNCTKSTVIRSALVSAGYRVSPTHANPQGLKTNAPTEAVWDVFRALAKVTPPKARSDRSPATIILAKPATFEADLTELSLSNKYSALAKFMPNPEDDWGPKARAAPGAQKRSQPERSVSPTGTDGAGRTAAGGDAAAGTGSDGAVNGANKRRDTQNKKRAKVNHPCKNFKPDVPNSCSFGDTCKYLHSDPSNPSSAASAAEATDVQL